ncbi:MAG TPA: SEC-C metal-binding domain-containing protein, partial [Caldisericia bacterium]|nr:SEC-C metal-binding domain-containing protein [Caldisericia bacterium]
VDSKWKDHLYNMDHLKEGIGLRGYGQQDPLVQYQIEGFQMFEDMLASIKEETISLLFKVRIQKDESSSTNTGKKVNSNNKSSGNNKPKLEINKSVTAPNVSDNVKKKIGRNDPCPCGSGKKYKKCCGKGL